MRHGLCRCALLALALIGASISGAGPSVFAWCASDAIAHACARAMRDAFAGAGLDSDAWVAPVAGPAAEVVACVT